MISLQDEIAKFQKMIYNKELAQFVTVDQMFVGEGITIQSLVRENNFIVEELKKMNNVFKNYCKLNDKVYQKIMEHQLATHTDQTKLTSIVSSVDRKFGDVIKEMKHIHEQSLDQKRKNQSYIKEALEPIKKEIALKVDATTFETKIKKVLQDYEEEEGQEGSSHNISHQKQNNENNCLNGQIVKKKGKVGYDDFYKLKQQIEDRLKVNEQKTIDLIAKKDQTAKIVENVNSQINKLQEQWAHDTMIRFEKLERCINENRREGRDEFNRLTKEMEEKLHDNVLFEKMEIYSKKQLHPLLTKLAEECNEINTKLSLQKQNVIKCQASLQELKSSMENKVRELKSEVMGNRQELTRFNNSNEQYRLNTNKELKQIRQYIQQCDKGSKQTIEQIRAWTNNQINSIHSTLASLNETVSEHIIKIVNKKIEKQLSFIQNDIVSNNRSINSTKNDIHFICEEIRNIKDILSKKANFTDIIQHIDKKADRQDFKELNTKINDQSQIFNSKMLNQSIQFNKLQNVESNHRKSTTATKNLKTLLGVQSPGRTEKNDYDSGTKLFMCGFDSHLGENRIKINHSSRKRSLKSSTAIVTDFGL